MTDTLPPLARDMLALFDNELSGQRFGDLDESSLRALADDLHSRATVVEEARLGRAAARAEHDSARAALLTRAEQSLAYARIYAASLEGEAAEGLVAHLDALTSRPKSKAKTRRPRAKKTPKVEEPSAEGELPFAAAS